MKTTKNQILAFIIGISIVVLCSCEKESIYEFGDMQTEFEVDSIYKANSDGFLTVQYISNIVGGESVIIYSDDTDSPSTIVGQINFPSTTTLPIKKNNFWKVVWEGYGNVIIGFTPILNIN